MAKDRNVYIKPMSWDGTLRFYVGHEPSNPRASIGHQLGSYFIIVDNLFSARCIAEPEAKRLGGEVVVCEHYVGFEGIAA